jgi:hypothetical protein
MSTTEVKLQRNKLEGIDLPDDPEFPFKMQVAFIHQAVHGNGLGLVMNHHDEVVFQGKSMEALLRFVETSQVTGSRLFVSFTITNPQGSQIYHYQ